MKKNKKKCFKIPKTFVVKKKKKKKKKAGIKLIYSKIHPYPVSSMIQPNHGSGHLQPPGQTHKTFL